VVAKIIRIIELAKRTRFECRSNLTQESPQERSHLCWLHRISNTILRSRPQYITMCIIDELDELCHARTSSVLRLRAGTVRTVCTDCSSRLFTGWFIRHRFWTQKIVHQFSLASCEFNAVISVKIRGISWSHTALNSHVANENWWTTSFPAVLRFRNDRCDGYMEWKDQVRLITLLKESVDSRHFLSFYLREYPLITFVNRIYLKLQGKPLSVTPFSTNRSFSLSNRTHLLSFYLL